MLMLLLIVVEEEVKIKLSVKKVQELLLDIEDKIKKIENNKNGVELKDRNLLNQVIGLIWVIQEEELMHKDGEKDM